MPKGTEKYYKKNWAYCVFNKVDIHICSLIEKVNEYVLFVLQPHILELDTKIYEKLPVNLNIHLDYGHSS